LPVLAVAIWSRSETGKIPVDTFALAETSPELLFALRRSALRVFKLDSFLLYLFRNRFIGYVNLFGRFIGVLWVNVKPGV
jgi:hypothetical protein